MITCSLTAATIWTPSKNMIMESMNKMPDKSLEITTDMAYIMGSLSGLSYSFFMIFVWACLYFGINYHYRLIHEKQLHIEAVRLSHRAQLKMLRYQINPHFLFNTLNAISTLVLMGNKTTANGMLTKLSTFLRFSLDSDPEKKTCLLEEIEALMLYLDIEKVRFEERLNIVLDIAEDTEKVLVPSFILQPLIENSIKYAIAHMPSDGTITIHSELVNERLKLIVSDNGPTKPHTLTNLPDSGVGLKNIQERLSVLYPNNFVFNAGHSTPSGFQVCMSIPAEYAHHVK